MRRALIGGLPVAGVAAALLAGGPGTRARSVPPARDPLASLPRVMLWAWERPANLGFIDPGEVGVAFLARTLYLRDGKVVSRGRRQPLTTPPTAALVAVVRLETGPGRRAPLSAEQRAQAVAEIAAVGRDRRLAAIQVDFDATRSERAFYRDLLRDLRRELPGSLKLSITALASWCLGDDWLRTAPVDEAVPMLFRMGPDERAVRGHLEAGGDFRPEVSRFSLGLSTDELPDALPRGRRLYIFHPRAWTEDDARRALAEVKRWQ